MAKKKLTITCTSCGKEVEVGEIQEGQDQSLFVCEDCQEQRNLPAYEVEIAELEGLGEEITDSQKTRLEYVKKKVASLKKPKEEE